MNDRFKFRVFHKPTNKTYLVWGFTPFNVVLNTLSMENLTLKRSECILMQSTGLKDKNGKLIYEGDIVKMHGWWDASGPAGYERDICVVEFDDSVCGFTPMCNYDCDCCVYHDAEECEVIGNIYQDKELLEVNNDR